LAAIVALFYFPTGLGVIGRKRWATVLGTLLGLNPIWWLINGIYFARRWRELGTPASHGLTASLRSEFMPISQRALGSMILEREHMQAAATAGKVHSADDQKKLAMANFVLGEKGDESILTTKKMTLEEAKDLRAIGDFTFGEVGKLLQAAGHSRGEVVQFLRDVQSGTLTEGEGIQFLNDCKEWASIKLYTDQNRDEFFAKKFAAHEAAQKKHPSCN
jgi:hypothetical protein